jgi:short-subunit dehydrogenase
VNITDRDAVAALPGIVEAAHGGPADAIVNVAGIIHRFAKIQDLSIEEIEKVIAVNYWGTVNVTKTFLPVLLGRPAAAIANFASMGALIPFPGQGAYGSSKGAVKLFTETLLAELQGTNVQVSLVFPGAVATNITGNSGVAAPGGAAADSAAESSMKPLAPTVAAEIVVAGIEKGAFRILVGKDAKTFDRLARLSPTRSIISIAKRVAPILGL